jgi:hypothetical protein
MAIAKEDIKPGFYWVRHQRELVIVRVESFLGPTLWVARHGSGTSDTLEDALEEFDFIARVEPPEGV